MREVIIAGVRTAVAAIVTGLVAFAAGYDVTLDPGALEAVLAGVAVGVVNLVLNWLETKLPFLAKLHSLGFSNETPSY